MAAQQHLVAVQMHLVAVQMHCTLWTILRTEYAAAGTLIVPSAEVVTVGVGALVGHLEISAPILKGQRRYKYEVCKCTG
jgi:hypothetical protein